MRTASVGFHCPSCAAGAPGGRTVHPLRQRTGDPTVTRVIIAVNAVVFFSGLVSGVSATDLFARGGGEMFTRFALLGPLVDQGEWWRLIGSAFLHAGLLHLAFNMFLACSASNWRSSTARCGSSASTRGRWPAVRSGSCFSNLTRSPSAPRARCSA